MNTSKIEKIAENLGFVVEPLNNSNYPGVYCIYQDIEVDKGPPIRAYLWYNGALHGTASDYSGVPMAFFHDNKTAASALTLWHMSGRYVPDLDHLYSEILQAAKCVKANKDHLEKVITARDEAYLEALEEITGDLEEELSGEVPEEEDLNPPKIETNTTEFWRLN